MNLKVSTARAVDEDLGDETDQNVLQNIPEHSLTKSCLLNLMPSTYFFLQQNMVLPAYNMK